MYPLRRNRRLRTSESMRGLVRETVLSPKDFIAPLFVVEGKGVKEEIASMPNYYRLSLDILEKEVKEQCGEWPYKFEGKSGDKWILIDYVNVVVHIMLPEPRKFYNLEEMWSDASVLEH